MGQFCEACGTEIGFFSRKRVQRSDGRVLTVCRSCVSEVQRSSPIPQTLAPQTPAPETATSFSRDAGAPPQFEVVDGAQSPGLAAAPTLDPSAEQLFQFLLQQTKQQTGVDVSGDALVVERLQRAAERAVTELQSQPSTEVNLPFITADATGPKHLLLTVRATER